MLIHLRSESSWDFFFFGFITFVFLLMIYDCFMIALMLAWLPVDNCSFYDVAFLIFSFILLFVAFVWVVHV